MRLPGWVLFILFALFALALWEMPGVVWMLVFGLLVWKTWQWRHLSRRRGVRL